MGLVKQTEFFDEVCFPPLLSFRLFSAAKHKKSRFYCFVLNRYAHTDARTLCIKSLLQQTHSKRERVKTGGLCTFFTRSSSLSPSLWLVIYVHWLGGLVSGKFQNKCLTKQQPTDENNAVIFAMCWLLLYTESPNDKKKTGSKNESLFNRNMSHTTFCRFYFWCIDAGSQFSFFWGKYCFFLLVQHCKISMNSVELAFAICNRRATSIYLFISFDKLKWILSSCWNRFVLCCWVFYCRFDSAFTMSFDVLLYIHRCRPSFVVEYCS